MNILFTGGSSFTGYWFIKELADKGHHITAIFTRATTDAYDPLRQKRIAGLQPFCRQVFNTRFGDDRFIQLLRENKYDMVCHHAAEVTDYKSKDFDVLHAMRQNTYNCRQVFAIMLQQNCCRLLLTGSVFEGMEGAGSDNLPHFSAYGLSKSLTAQLLQYYATELGIATGKFVIPNPFGPYEEKRFIYYLFSHWVKNETPQVNTPLYIRDNIHIRLLAGYYAYYIDLFAAGNHTPVHFAPQGYIETQEAFSLRVAREMAGRINKECAVQFKKQTVFEEPLFRVNTDSVPFVREQFNETRAWDELAAYYLDYFAQG